MSDSTTDSKPRMTKQGVRDLNPHGPKAEKRAPLGPNGVTAGPAETSPPAATTEKPAEAPSVVS